MFIRKKKNQSGSISVQILKKAKGRNILVKSIGCSKNKEELFRHITLARLTYPVSKLKTTEYLLQHQNIDIDVDKKSTDF